MSTALLPPSWLPNLALLQAGSVSITLPGQASGSAVTGALRSYAVRGSSVQTLDAGNSPIQVMGVEAATAQASVVARAANATPVTISSVGNAAYLGQAGAGRDSVSLLYVTNAYVSTGDGADWIRVQSANAGTVMVDAGAGNDTVIVQGNGRQTAQLLLGDGSDSLTLSGMARADILAGSGNDTITTTLEGVLAIDGGTGSDLVAVQAALADVRFRLGQDGVLLLSRAGSTAEMRLSAVETLSFAGGERLTTAQAFARAQAGGAVLGTEGADRVTLTRAQAEATAAWSVETRAGDDVIAVSGAPGTTRLTLSAGEGNDLVTLSGLAAAEIRMEAGADTIQAGIGGDLAIDGGQGNDLLALSGTFASLSVRHLGDGRFEFRGAGEADRILATNIESFAFAGGAAISRNQLLALVAPPPVVPAPVVPATGLPPLGADWVAPVSAAKLSTGAAQSWISGRGVAATQQGTTSNDSFGSIAPGSTLAGGKGDDVYNWVPDSVKVVERVGEGIDTVTYGGWYDFTLPDNVENLLLLATTNQPLWGDHMRMLGYAPSSSGIGNALDNVLVGGAGDNRLDGRAGNDIMTGGGGRDTFVIAPGSGHDRVTDFAPGVDRIRIGSGMTDWATVKANLFDTREGVVLRLSQSDTMTLVGRRVADLSATDFELPVDLARYRMSFRDEFDAFSRLDGDGAADGGTWRTRMFWGDGTRKTSDDAQAFVDANRAGIGVDPFSVRDGALRIEGTWRPDLASQLDGREFVSGTITTQGSFAQLYGYFEARMKLPEWVGGFPAFWMLAVDLSWPPEIDIMEQLGAQADRIHQMGGTLTLDTAEWHVYSLEWTPDRLAWFVDGQMTHVVTNHNQHKAMYILLEYGLGSWGGAVAKPTVAGGSVGTVEIDWVRAYELIDGAAPAATAAQGAPMLTYAAGNLRPGATPGAAESWHHLADTSGWLALTANDLGIAALGNSLTTVVTELVDSPAQKFTSTAGWVGVDLSAQLRDLDGGDFRLENFAMVDLQAGGQAGSRVTLNRVQQALVETGSGDDTITVNAPTFMFTTRAALTEIRAGAGNDTITGWTGHGTNGQTWINALVVDAGSGNDRVIGSIGHDTLVGGAGADTLSGGSGRDVFVYRAGASGTDLITDFVSGTDKLRFEGVSAGQLAMRATGDGLFVSLPDGSILLKGIAALATSDLVFA